MEVRKKFYLLVAAAFGFKLEGCISSIKQISDLTKLR